MNQDQNSQNYNPQNNDFTGNSSLSNPQSNFVSPSPIHFSPSTINLDALSAKSNLNSLNNSSVSTDFNQQNFNPPPYQPTDQFNNFNPYQNTGSNINNLQNFAPQDNFDTGFSNQEFNPNTDFNQNGLDQYKASTPQFNANDPYLIPSTNPEMDDLDDSDVNELEKPQRDTKKILMFGLIGLIVVLLVASVALFFLSQNKTPTNTANNTISGKPTTQGLPATDKTGSSAISSEQNTAVDSVSKTGNPNTPASKSIVNTGATAVTNEWIGINFTKAKGALGEDGGCKLQAVCGPKSDPDKDGLSNLDEFIYGTNPNIADIDGDGISDKDELYIYYTDPINADTNENTFKDGVELTNCYDPLIPSQKLTKARLNEISSNVYKPYVNGLSNVTQTTLKTAGAKVSELEKGYLSKCAVTSPQDTTPEPKSTTNTNKNPSTAQPKPDTSNDTSTNEGA
jgi:hypothetical protein